MTDASGRRPAFALKTGYLWDREASETTTLKRILNPGRVPAARSRRHPIRGHIGRDERRPSRSSVSGKADGQTWNPAAPYRREVSEPSLPFFSGPMSSAMRFRQSGHSGFGMPGRTTATRGVSEAGEESVQLSAASAARAPRCAMISARVINVPLRRTPAAFVGLPHATVDRTVEGQCVSIRNLCVLASS